MKKENLRAIIISAIFGGLGFVLMLLEFPLPMIIPSFIKLRSAPLSRRAIILSVKSPTLKVIVI